MTDAPLSPWAGGDRPHPPTTYVELRQRDGQTIVTQSAFVRWWHESAADDVVAFREVPKAAYTASRLHRLATEIRELGVELGETGHHQVGQTLAYGSGLVLGACSRLKAELKAGEPDAAV